MKSIKDLLELPILPEAKVAAMVAALSPDGLFEIHHKDAYKRSGSTTDELVLGARILRAEGISVAPEGQVKLAPEWRECIENTLLIELPVTKKQEKKR